MKDTFGNDLQIGDYLILTVSRGSQYLTSAQIQDIDEKEGKVEVIFDSTIKTKWIRPEENTMKYIPQPMVLDPRTNLCRDCTGQIIQEGQKVAYRNRVLGCDPISFGVVKEVKSELWVILENGAEIRNNGIFVLCS